MSKPKALVLVGPTGIGKSRIAQIIARKSEGEIVHADSRQVYRYMNIGTAKPSPAERREIPHHLLDVIDPDETFSAGRYRELAWRALREIANRKRLPILEGGCGFYLRAVTEGLFEGPGANPGYRQELKRKGEEHGPSYLYNILQEVDPLTAAKLHPHDEVRIVRALEVFYATGRPISAWRANTQTDNRFSFVWVGLTQDRAELYQWIEARVDAMLEQGLIEEVEGLLADGYHECLPSMQTLGYKQMVDYLKGRCRLDEAVSEFKKHSRRYAKRQLTWFRRNPEIRWHKIDYQRGEEFVAQLLHLLD